MYQNMPEEQVYTNNGSISGKEIMQLLLLKKDTREFSIFELPVSELALNQPLDYNISKTSNNALDEQWFMKVFKPAVKGDLARDSFPSSKREFEYTDGPGNDYYYFIEVEKYINCFDFNGASTVQDDFGLRVLRNV